MNSTRPTLKLKFKISPILQKKLEVYLPNKVNVTTKPKSATLSPKAKELKNNHAAKEINNARNKIHKNTSAVKVDREIINVRRVRHKAQYQEVLHILQKLYPHSFTIPVKLLAIGIHKELLQLAPNGFSRKRIRMFLRKYCQSFMYQKILVEGAVRVNLDGSEHSKVTKEQVPIQRKFKPKT